MIVTGGAGFIGSNLIAALNRRGQTDILVVDHLNHPSKKRNLDRLRFREYIDKTDFRQRLRSGKLTPPAAVYHLGACSSTTEFDEHYLEDNNERYTRELCEWSLSVDARFIYASSAATYGNGDQGYSDDDTITALLQPLNPYGCSKQAFDRWALDNGILRQIAGLKYFNVYGPGEDHKGEMRSMVNKAMHQIGRTGEIALFKSYRTDYADGEQQRDFVYVDDAVAMTLFFGDHPDISGLFNCGTGRARTWNDLAAALFKALGLPLKIRYIDMPREIRDKYQYHTQADMTKARSAGYTQPFLDIEEGTRRYVEAKQKSGDHDSRAAPEPFTIRVEPECRPRPIDS